MMVLDSCLFFQEYDMLEFRLKYLWDVVDKFIIVESDRTFSGEKKTLNFFNNMERFKWAMDKIVYYPVEIDVAGLDFSIKPTELDWTAPQWKVEFQQRAAIIAACESFADDDILMMSDCDEIPATSVVRFRRDTDIKHPFTCQQSISVYTLDYMCPAPWGGTTMSTLGYAREKGTQVLRDMRHLFAPMPRAGWHLSYFGGAEQIRKKIQVFSHQELNRSEYTNLAVINDCIENGGSIFPDSPQLVDVGKDFYPKDFLDKCPKEWWL